MPLLDVESVPGRGHDIFGTDLDMFVCLAAADEPECDELNDEFGRFFLCSLMVPKLTDT